MHAHGETSSATQKQSSVPLSKRARDSVKLLARTVLPVTLRRWIWSRFLGTPAAGMVRFGDLRRIEPLSRIFGSDRGLPVDRYYIEQFLAAHAADIQGRVLEIGHNVYTRKFGAERVTKSDVLHI